MSTPSRELVQERQPGEVTTSTSVLFRRTEECAAAETGVTPACFQDLRLDSIVARITAGREQYDLAPYYRFPLRTTEDVAFRQDVMRALDDSAALREAIGRFTAAMQIVRDRRALAENLHHSLQRNRWFLDAAHTYCQAVTRLGRDLAQADVKAQELVRFRAYLEGYLGSAAFQAFERETQELEDSLHTIRYSVLVEGLRVRVSVSQGTAPECDYGARVADTFRPFRQDGGSVNSRFRFSELPDMNVVEASILECVARLYPRVFADLGSYVDRHQGFADMRVLAFEREIQFYLAYLEYMAAFREAGLHFCYPRVTLEKQNMFAEQGYDLALAATLLAEGATPVCNDFRLAGGERIIVVTGPNQGGKTTFARTFAQLHYLAALGCPVPAARAQLPLADAILTHFEQGEAGLQDRGKLEDDLLRIRDILAQATPRSILILNEIFNATTARDARLLSHRIMEKIAARDALCVWATFLDELTAANPKTLSMVATVDPDNPLQRTYRIVRKPPDGLAYALSLAEQYGLSAARLAERLNS